MLFDFSMPASAEKWNIVNDSVMGGISTSTFKLNQDSTATFSGNVSADNNGGFASVRASISNKVNSDFDGVTIRVKGDGNIYSLRFRTDRNFDGMSYQAKIKTIKDQWTEFSIPFSDFMPTFRGRMLYNKPALESKDIRQIGILIADYQLGSFEIDVDWIKFY